MDGQSVVRVLFGVGAIGVGFVVLLIGRELVTWYWKVNEGLEQLGRLESVLRNIDKNLIVLTDNSERPQRPIPRDEPGVPR